MITVVFHKRIPGLKRFTSRTGRILWGMFFIFIPSSIVSQYFSSTFQNQIQQSYQLNAKDFMQYRMNGDVLRMND